MHPGRPLLPLLFAVLLLVSGARDAQATNVKFSGNVAYSFVGATVVLTADQVQNLETTGASGTLQIELWALPAAYAGGAITGYKLAQYSLGPLTAGFAFPNVNSGTLTYAQPPIGTWFYAMILTEYIGPSSGPDNGYIARDFVNFTTPVVIGISPRPGIWENPNELGTGYSMDFNHGVLVVVFYSFTANDVPQWYISSGPIVGNSFTGTLDKFVAGQCITASCPYKVPTAAGNDGTVKITFTSNTAATMYLPGGRAIPIHPSVF